MEALYTVYLKFKESDIPHTRIEAATYRILNLKSPCIPYTKKPWPALIKSSRLTRPREMEQKPDQIETLTFICPLSQSTPIS